MAANTKVVIISLILIIVVLGGIVLYSFVVKPQISGYVTSKQVEGANIALSQVLAVVSQCQTFPVDLGNGQSINLVALECLQAPTQQGAQTTSAPAA